MDITAISSSPRPLSLEELFTILDGIENSKLIIPEVQRPYSWGVPQIAAFYYDIERALVESKKDRSNHGLPSGHEMGYFLGSFLLSSPVRPLSPAKPAEAKVSVKTKSKPTSVSTEDAKDEKGSGKEVKIGLENLGAESYLLDGQQRLLSMVVIAVAINFFLERDPAFAKSGDKAGMSKRKEVFESIGALLERIRNRISVHHLETNADLNMLLSLSSTKFSEHLLILLDEPEHFSSHPGMGMVVKCASIYNEMGGIDKVSLR